MNSNVPKNFFRLFSAGVLMAVVTSIVPPALATSSRPTGPDFPGGDPVQSEAGPAQPFANTPGSVPINYSASPVRIYGNYIDNPAPDLNYGYPARSYSGPTRAITHAPIVYRQLSAYHPTVAYDAASPYDSDPATYIPGKTATPIYVAEIYPGSSPVQPDGFAGSLPRSPQTPNYVPTAVQYGPADGAPAYSYNHPDRPDFPTVYGSPDYLHRQSYRASVPLAYELPLYLTSAPKLAYVEPNAYPEPNYRTPKFLPGAPNQLNYHASGPFSNSGVVTTPQAYYRGYFHPEFNSPGIAAPSSPADPANFPGISPVSHQDPGVPATLAATPRNPASYAAGLPSAIDPKGTNPSLVYPSNRLQKSPVSINRWDDEAQKDMQVRASRESRFWRPVEDSFKKNMSWLPGWELRWWAFSVDNGATVWVYHARAKSTGERYTSFVDSKTGQLENWESAR